MATLRCRACGLECEIEYRAGPRKCPECGSADVQLAYSVDEISEDDPLWAAIEHAFESSDAESSDAD